MISGAVNAGHATIACSDGKTGTVNGAVKRRASNELLLCGEQCMHGIPTGAILCPDVIAVIGSSNKLTETKTFDFGLIIKCTGPQSLLGAAW